MDCEDCRHLTVVGLHDTGPWRRSVEEEMRTAVTAWDTDKKAAQNRVFCRAVAEALCSTRSPKALVNSLPISSCHTCDNSCYALLNNGRVLQTAINNASVLGQWELGKLWLDFPSACLSVCLSVSLSVSLGFTLSLHVGVLSLFCCLC